jgi:hypothetical protein
MEIPDRLSIDPASPYYNKEVLDRRPLVLFKGVEQTNVAEYCISEQWVRKQLPNTRDRRGRLMTFKVNGKLDVRFRAST